MISRLVDTNKYSAMAEFRRRTEDRTDMKGVLKILHEIADQYKVTAVYRQGSLHPHIFTLGFKDDNAEVTTTFNGEPL